MKNSTKKLSILLFAVSLGITAFSQTNTFPSSGNVGIGTVTPTYKLQVEGPANTWKARIGGDDGYIDFGPANSSWAHIYTDRPNFIFNKSIYSIGGAFSSYSSGNLYLQTNGNTRLAILNSNGNIGIGTSSPREKLEVNGHLLIPSDKLLKFGTENSSTGSLTIHNASCCYNTYADFTGNLYFRPESGQGNTISFQKDGTVLIGMWPRYENSVTPTDGNKLSVNGGILCESITVVESVPTSDYVFESDYKLRNLNEIEEFVRENKHLPEVPSAKEFKENGYKLGEMDDLLLRKIEELTLYLIEQNKRIEALEAENTKLNAKSNQ